MSSITMWWEEGISPVVLEVVITQERWVQLLAERRKWGARLFCGLCEVEGIKLVERGFAIDNEDSGELYCLKCLFEPTTMWGMLVRGDALEELSDPVGQHRIT